MRQVLRRPERLFLGLLVGGTLVSLLFSSWHLPQPIRHPGFDSSVFMSPTRSKSTTTTRTSEKVCDGYDGVLLIESGDAGAAAGTVFFQYIISQLIYADKYNLLPWIHLNNVSKHVFDPMVHGGGNTTTTTTVSFEMMYGMTVRYISDNYRRYGFGSYAGPPEPLLPNFTLTLREYQVEGTGVWNHYFQPVSDFQPGDCPSKPLIRMQYYHLNPSMLFFCPWSVKSWPYNNLRLKLQPRKSLKEWYEPMRQQGHTIVQKYIRFQPQIVQQVNELLLLDVEESSMGSTSNSSVSCLAMHIRHSDKGGTNRKKIPIEAFLPYAQAYLQAGGSSIYLATDSTDVLKTIPKQWPKDVLKALIRQSDDVLRSSNRKAVFVLGETNHHRTNTEVLVDILAMSKCQFFVHGFSAVSEAVMYLNLELHHQSVDLEAHPKNLPMSPKGFEELVRKQIRKQP